MAIFRRMRSYLFIVVILLGFGSSAQSKLTISMEQVYTLALEGEPDGLFDEQEAAGDPENGKFATPKSNFDHISRPHNNHAEYIIDLKARHQLSALWIFDVNASDTIFLYSGTIGAFREEGFIVTNKYLEWHRLPLKGEARFIKMRFRSMGAKVGEVIFYGKPSEKLEAAPRSTLKKDGRTVPIGQLLGVNAFNWSPDSLLSAAAAVREYRDWSWADNSENGGAHAWSPGYKFDADDFYRRAKQKGLDVVACLQLTADWLRQGRDPNCRPHFPDADRRETFRLLID